MCIFTTKNLQKKHSCLQSQKAVFFGFSAQCMLEALNIEGIKVSPQLVLNEQERLEKEHINV